MTENVRVQEYQRKPVGRIRFGSVGMIHTYACTCGGDCEPSEIGVVCLKCGASSGWERWE